MRIKVDIVGKGNVGHHLYEGLRSHCDVHVLSRNELPRENVDCVLVAVPDSMVLKVCAGLGDDVFVAHTAGAVEMPGVGRRGVFYPLYSFTKGTPLDWSKVPMLLEATGEDELKVLEELARALGSDIFHLNTAQREKLHVAAVKVNNFTNHLYTLAFDYAQENGLPVEVLYPIIRQGPEKAISLGPHSAQTGPAKRGDITTINKHIEHISREDVKALYKMLSDSISNWHK
ncbi:MAG: hypothetical protein RL754_247 [Bacteroidota bacterium]|jgi:predicted short-subunit dehydrogenase-like oxidoreductase (DUF2520 family)